MDYDNRFERILGSVSKDKFRQNANKLLNECFMLKECADTKNSYYFVLKEKELFSAYFDLLGYELIINEEYGIIALNNSYGTGRIRLRLLDSIILLFLRLIYIEERKKLSQSEQVIVYVDELYERYRSLKNERLKKPDMRSALGLLKRYNIVSNLDADMGNPDTRLQIYPSVILAFDVGELNKVYEETKDKGSAIITIKGQRLNLSVLNGDIAISSALLPEISSISVTGSRVMTIENLTTFNAFHESDTFAVYLGGYHNSHRRNFINKIYNDNPDAEYYHFGDIDAGGFYILLHLRAKTGVHFMPYHMGIPELQQFKSYTKPLTENDVKRLTALLDSEFSDTLNYMMKNNCKLEQEALDMV